MDVSDGLLIDAERLAAASKLAVSIDLARMPVSKAAAARAGRTDADLLRLASSGDDYELLFTLPDGVDPRCAATRIGTILPNAGLPLLIDGHLPIDGATLGYQHRG